MKKQLELKHLAAYLPYGVRVIDMDPIYEEDSTHELKGIENYFENDGEFECLVGRLPSTNCLRQRLFFKQIKPILRPLSDLTKPITHNGETFVPMKKLGWVEKWGDAGMGEVVYCEYGENPRTTVNAIDHIESLQMLWSWHFDTFGLIEDGLAVDINTLNEQK